jgi:ATP-binding cassette subfamily B protein
MNIEPKHPMRRLFLYLRKYKRIVSFASITVIIHKIFDLMPPLLVGWIVNIANKDTPNWIVNVLGTNEIMSAVVFISVLIVVIFGMESLTQWLYKIGFMRLAQRVQHDLRLDAYQQLQSREIAYFENNRTGNLMAMINDDVNQLERFLNFSLDEIIQLITLFIFAGFVLFGVSWELTLIGLLPVPIIYLGSLQYQKKIGPLYKKVREAVGNLSNRLENNIAGILVIKSFNAEKYEINRVAEVSDQYRKANFDAIQYSAPYIPMIRMVIALGFAAVMGIGAMWVIQDPTKMNVGELTLFGMMIQRVLWPITRMGMVIDEYERARASARRIFGLMDTPNQIQVVENPVPLNTLEKDIQFKNVAFAYDSDMSIFKNLSFNIQHGQRIGIAGSTGSGKSTLIKLILRFYDVNNGQITFDGRDIRALDLQDVRKQIALVSQDVYLFHGTIFENIAYGCNDTATKEQVISACKKAQLHSFIDHLPDQYDTLVGERGIKLSGGQRQRLSIARAILKDAPVLILDEATSAVDTETERAIQESIHRLTEDKTALIIAHRLSTIRHCDQIIVLKNGDIEEQGTHDELIEKDGLYADLWHVQTGELVV